MNGETLKRAGVGSVPQMRRTHAAWRPLFAALYSGCHL